MKIEEKITLTCGRDGGLQNMELHGMIMLRISDEKFGRIRLHVENEDKKGVQLQVCKGFYIEYLDIIYLAQSSFLGLFGFAGLRNGIQTLAWADFILIYIALAFFLSVLFVC